ncbi:protein-tyrosine phosphatase-like protein [Mucidula mucida]|nr:protein-tyrosine phosphatase-like protein [Mucidula mucida]
MIRFDSMPLAVQEAMCTPMHLILPATPSSSRPTGALYLGSMAALHESENLSRANITHLVQVLDAPWHPFSEKAGFHSYKIDIMDVSTADLKPHLEKVCEYIEAAMRRGESVLVHCQQGISRSASVVIAYLIRNRGMSYDNAFALVRRQRACVKPNAGFVQALKDWETAWQRPAMGRRFTT